MLLVALGLFWMQGRAQVEEGAPPPEFGNIGGVAVDPDALPASDAADMTGPEPPEASELTREQRRFFRYDRNRDRKITRNEMLSTRTDGFRKLDMDGNNLLTFEEWAVTTAIAFCRNGRRRERRADAGRIRHQRTSPAPHLAAKLQLLNYQAGTVSSRASHSPKSALARSV